MANSTPIQSTILPAVPVVVLGTDALIAAAPATPVQLVHACLRGGFVNVIPSSWGDELIASAVLRRLANFNGGPAIQCSCPIVAHRLLSAGADLRPAMIGLVPPPVAIARYIRAIAAPSNVRITFVGACPGAVDSSIDIRMTPSALIELLAERGILIDEQPRVFDSVLPYDRRRHHSQPGGLPSVDALWSATGARTIVEAGGEDIVAEVAQQLFSGKSVLIDAAPALGCACSGAVAGIPAREARQRVLALEPPRAPTPIVDDSPLIELDLQIPAAPRTAVDVMAAPPRNAPRGVATRAKPAELSRAAESLVVTQSSTRSLLAAAAVARNQEGKALPRAYVARRRNTPRNTPVVRDFPDDQPPSPVNGGESF